MYDMSQCMNTQPTLDAHFCLYVMCAFYTIASVLRSFMQSMVCALSDSSSLHNGL